MKKPPVDMVVGARGVNKKSSLIIRERKLTYFWRPEEVAVAFVRSVVRARLT